MNTAQTQIQFHLEPEGADKAVVQSRERRKGIYEGEGYRFYHQSALKLQQCADNSIALTITSPPYWNAIDYDVHSSQGQDAWHGNRYYQAFGAPLKSTWRTLRKCSRTCFAQRLRAGSAQS